MKVIANLFRLIVLVFLIMQCLDVLGQSETRFSQYQFSQGLINPAYNAIQPDPVATLLTRVQWVEIDGAPLTTAMNVILPTKRRAGFGLNMVGDNIGIIRSTELSFSYGYRIPLGREFRRPGYERYNKYFSFGLTAGIIYNRLNYSELQVHDQNDPLFGANTRETRAKFGFGLLYYSPNLMFGISTPSLARTEVVDQVNNLVMVDEVNWNFQLQLFHEFNKSLGIKPAVLMKLVEGSPSELDFNLSLLFNRSLWLGMGYRSSRAMLAYTEVFFKPAFYVSYSFDYFSFKPEDIRNASAHEFRLSVNLDQVFNPKSMRNRPMFRSF